MNKTLPITRRAALRTVAAASVLPLVHIRTPARPANSRRRSGTIGCPGNEAMQKQVDAWAAKNKVEVTARLHHLERQQAPADRRRRGAGRTGHDFLPLSNWDVQAYASQLAPIDEPIRRWSPSMARTAR